jgi:CBS-domain-containing membrane protein
LPKVHARDEAAQSIAALASGDVGVVAVVDEFEHVIGVVTPAELQRAMALVGAIQAGMREAR